MIETFVRIIDVLVESKICLSRSDAKRKLDQGAVRINGVKVNRDIILSTKEEYILNVGKMIWKKIILEKKMKTEWDKIRDILDDLESEDEKKDDKIEELEKEVVSLEKEVASLEEEVSSLEKDAFSKSG